MKKFFAVIAILTSCIGASAQLVSETNATMIETPATVEDTEYSTTFFNILYQSADFSSFKESSYYGIGGSFTSLTHRGCLHVGFNYGFLYNGGFVDSGEATLQLEIGPSVRIDLGKRVFLNIPVAATWAYNNHGQWFMKASPSINFMLSRKTNFFIGPLVSVPFESDYDTTFGLHAGIGFDF